MEYLMMNKDRPVLRFDLEEMYIQVIDNRLLPYPLKDYVLTSGEKDMRGMMRDIQVLRDYLASRTLNFSRENAKVILNCSSLPQSLNTEQRLKIVTACSGLTMQDSFWIKKDGDDRRFEDVCLRKVSLREASYDIAILGKHISSTANELAPDLTTEGMFPKYWHRTGNGDVELWKTDKIGGANSRAEVKASEIAKMLGVPALSYRIEEKDGLVFSVCKCIANDEVSLIPIQDIIDWHVHIGREFPKELEIKPFYYRAFANMCLSDYITANTDRHNNNWGVLVNDSNEIISMSPLYDFNQALIADEFGTNIDELIYEPTGKTFRDSIEEWAFYADVNLSEVKNSDVSDKVKQRISIIEEILQRKRS